MPTRLLADELAVHSSVFFVKGTISLFVLSNGRYIDPLNSFKASTY